MLQPTTDAMRITPEKADSCKVPSTERHIFNHFDLKLIVYRAVVPSFRAKASLI